MDPSTLQVAPSGTKTQWAKPQDWEKYRNTITALFMCHSLPVVMRVMREEHRFHATPKMFQSQIYQKWGLRKTKPGEAKKEAKERKRRRQDSEDEESVESDLRSQEPINADNTNAHQRSSQTLLPTNANQVEELMAMPEIPELFAQSTKPKARDSTQIVPQVQTVVPRGWKDFLDQSQGPPLQPTDPTIVASSSSGTDSSIIASSATNLPVAASSATDAPVIASTAAPGFQSSSDQYHPAEGTLSTAKTRSIRSFKKSRASRSPSEDQIVFSPPNSAKHARYIAAISKPMGTIRHIESAAQFLVPERAMFYARHFISSTYATGIWAMVEPDSSVFEVECGKLEHWYNDFNPGFDCLRRQKVKTAFRLLKRCFANTTAVLSPQDPRLVVYICQQAIRCMFYDRLGRNLAQTLLKHIAGLCQVLFSRHHPLFAMFTFLSRMDSFEFAQNIRPFMDCYFDHLEPFVEDSITAFGQLTEMRGLTISLMESTGMMGIYEAKPVLDKLVLKAQHHKLPTLHLKIEMAAVLQRNSFFLEALALIKEVRECEEADDNPYEILYACITLILTLRKMKDFEGAIKASAELVESLSRPPKTFPGWPNNMTLQWREYMESRQSSLLLVLGQREKDLRDAGRIKEAEEVQARLDREVAQDYGVEDLNEDAEAAINAMV